MKKSEQFLAKLKAEKDFWHKKVEELPGDTISTNHPYYKMSVNAANKYAAAKYMFDLMQEETEDEIRKAQISSDDFEPITRFFRD